MDIVAGELLSPISTKLDDSGSAGRFSAALISMCCFNPSKAQRKVSGSIIVTLMADRERNRERERERERDREFY